MNKIFTRVIGGALGLAMAVGVGAAVGASFVNNKEALPVLAAEGDTHDMGISFSKLLNNNATIDSVTIPVQSYTVAKITMNVRYNKTLGGVTVTPTIGTTGLDSQTHNANSTVDLEWTVDPAQQAAITFDFVNNCGSGTGKGTFYVNSVKLTEGPDDGKTTVELQAEDVALQIGQSDYAPVIRDKATSEEVTGCTLTSSVTSVATIVDGKIHPVAKGTTQITASHVATSDKKFVDAKFTVTVWKVDTIQTVVTDLIENGGPTDEYTIEGTVTGDYSSTTKNNYMIQQGNYGMYLYNVGKNLVTGDVVRVRGTFKSYYKWFESSTISSCEKIDREGESFSPAIITDVSTLTDEYQNRLVSFKGLTYESGTYEKGTDKSIIFKLGDVNVTLRTTGGAANEDAINAKLDKVFEAKTTATFNLVGVHYTVYNSSRQFKVDSPDKIVIIPNGASDEQIVQQFVDDYMHMTDYDPSLSGEGDNSCLGVNGYYELAKRALTSLEQSQINEFKNNDSFNNAQARYEAWATAYGDSTPYATTYSLSKTTTALANQKTANAAIVLIISSISLVALGGFLVIRRKKEQ